MTQIEFPVKNTFFTINLSDKLLKMLLYIKAEVDITNSHEFNKCTFFNEKTLPNV